jgi:transcriptional regulator with XRE-family HTH domain
MSVAGPQLEFSLAGLEDSSADATVLRIMLGSQLRRLREAAGITPEQAGYEIRASESKINRLEKGKVGPKHRDVADLLALYGVTDETLQAKFLDLARRSNEPDWWAPYRDSLPTWFETYLGFESAAATVRTFEAQFVHPLFQTEDYARAVLLLRGKKMSPGEAERKVALRLARQGLLHRPNPPRIWSVMDEATLRRQVGGPAVLRDQLRQLLEISELEHVTLQVVPFASGVHAGDAGSFTVLRFEERNLPDVVYLEQLTVGACLDQRPDVERYLEAADEISSQALTPAQTTQFIEQAAHDL